jgi:Icc-related predicted phosphoesterase
MKIIAFSDIHGQQNEKLTHWFNGNSADLLIFAGDLQKNQTTDYGRDFINWFHGLPYPEKILVYGNHDSHYKEINNYLEINKKMFSEITVLNNSSVNIDGIEIFGSPHSVEYGSWWFMMKDEDLAGLWKLIPNNTNILITHGPPYGILDNTCEGIAAGSKTLLERLKKLNDLKYHIFGHIHEGNGIKKVDYKTFLNVSLLDERYQFVNMPIIIDYHKYNTDTDYNVGE